MDYGVLQVAGCGNDLSRERDSYRRYRICEEHLNLTALRCADGQDQRFCQQCGWFHPLAEFDGEKKNRSHLHLLHASWHT